MSDPELLVHATIVVEITAVSQTPLTVHSDDSLALR